MDHNLSINIPNPPADLRDMLFEVLNNYGLDTYSFNVFKSYDDEDSPEQEGEKDNPETWTEKQEEVRRIVKTNYEAFLAETAPKLEPDPNTDAGLLEMISDALSKLGPQSSQAYDSRNREQRFVLLDGKLYRWCDFCHRTHAL